MFRFLPEEVRVKAEREYALRRASVMLTLASILLLFTACALLPSLIISSVRRDAALATLASAERSGSTGEKEALEAWAGRIEGYARHLAPIGPKGGAYEYFHRVLAKEPAGISILSLSSAEMADSQMIRVSGVAKDRQALLQFESALRGSGEWESTSFPVSNLAKDSDISFELTLVPKE